MRQPAQAYDSTENAPTTNAFWQLSRRFPRRRRLLFHLITVRTCKRPTSTPDSLRGAPLLCVSCFRAAINKSLAVIVSMTKEEVHVLPARASCSHLTQRCAVGSMCAGKQLRAPQVLDRRTFSFHKTHRLAHRSIAHWPNKLHLRQMRGFVATVYATFFKAVDLPSTC